MEAVDTSGAEEDSSPRVSGGSAFVAVAVVAAVEGPVAGTADGGTGAWKPVSGDHLQRRRSHSPWTGSGAAEASTVAGRVAGVVCWRLWVVQEQLLSAGAVQWMRQTRLLLLRRCPGDSTEVQRQKFADI